MARGDVLMVQLPETDARETEGAHPAIALQTNADNDQPYDACRAPDIEPACNALSLCCAN